jgi:hypothetical protein
MRMLKGFKQFLRRGNVVDLAVAVVVPVNAIVARSRRGEAPPDPTTRKCPECLSDVPIAARRCAFRTSPLPSK